MHADSAVVGFYDAVRAYIVHCLATTFQKVSKASLSQALRLDGASLDTLVRDADVKLLL